MAKPRKERVKEKLKRYRETLDKNRKRAKEEMRPKLTPIISSSKSALAINNEKLKAMALEFVQAQINREQSRETMEKRLAELQDEQLKIVEEINANTRDE